jgi:hypothetical protein
VPGSDKAHNPCWIRTQIQVTSADLLLEIKGGQKFFSRFWSDFWRCVRREFGLDLSGSWRNDGRSAGMARPRVTNWGRFNPARGVHGYL